MNLDVKEEFEFEEEKYLKYLKYGNLSNFNKSTLNYHLSRGIANIGFLFYFVSLFLAYDNYRVLKIIDFENKNINYYIGFISSMRYIGFIVVLTGVIAGYIYKKKFLQLLKTMDEIS